jgi:nicotinamidase-related amidase
MQWGTAPAWVAAGLSFIFGLQSWLSSRNSKAERVEAAKQAERTERAVQAAERQAHAAERVVALHEAHEQRQAERIEAAEERPWELLPIPGDDNCWLHNTTEAAKYAVQVEGIDVRFAPKRFDVIEGGQKGHRH